MQTRSDRFHVRSRPVSKLQRTCGSETFKENRNVESNLTNPSLATADPICFAAKRKGSAKNSERNKPDENGEGPIKRLEQQSAQHLPAPQSSSPSRRGLPKTREKTETLCKRDREVEPACVARNCKIDQLHSYLH
jgi:hypothetical protein